MLTVIVALMMMLGHESTLRNRTQETHTDRKHGRETDSRRYLIQNKHKAPGIQRSYSAAHPYSCSCSFSRGFYQKHQTHTGAVRG